MQVYNCIIIEDEPLAAQLLQEYIAQIPQLKFTGHYRTAMEALVPLQEQKTDILFLDIHLPGIKGFNFLRTLHRAPAVIVTTAYHQYALEGYELNVRDYLIKPVSFTRFSQAVTKAIPSLSGLPVNTAQLPESILLPVDRKKIRLELDKILYVESKREYVQVVTTGGEYISKITTMEMEEMLPQPMFQRVHRSFIVSMDKITAFSKTRLDLGVYSIPIGKSYRARITL